MNTGRNFFFLLACLSLITFSFQVRDLQKIEQAEINLASEYRQLAKDKQEIDSLAGQLETQEGENENLIKRFDEHKKSYDELTGEFNSASEQYDSAVYYQTIIDRAGWVKSAYDILTDAACPAEWTDKVFNLVVDSTLAISDIANDFGSAAGAAKTWGGDISSK